jgi:hypothetical protein
VLISEQQKTIEENCPQIAAEDEELWRKFIARDFGVDAVEKIQPKMPGGWARVYEVCNSSFLTLLFRQSLRFVS